MIIKDKVNDMNENIKAILENIFHIVIDCEQCKKSDRACMFVYRSILDTYATSLVFNSFENEKVVSEIMRLSTLERVIIAFHFILALDLNEISVIIRTSPGSVYSQKSKAIRKMRISLVAA